VEAFDRVLLDDRLQLLDDAAWEVREQLRRQPVVVVAGDHEVVPLVVARAGRVDAEDESRPGGL